MTFNLSSIMTMIKARQHKYTHRKMIGRDPKTNRIRYRYYYAEHHGGGITSAEIEAGSAFKLTFKGRRGHFHVQRTEGDKVFVKHDGRPNAKEVEMTKSELRALLKAQHETIETKKREKAQEARRGKKRKGTERKKTQTPREKLTETAQPTAPPPQSTTKDLLSMEGEERQKALRDFSKEDLLKEGRKIQRQIKAFHEKIDGDEGVKRAKLKQEQAERAGDWKQAREHARDLKRERDRVIEEQGGKKKEYRIKDTIRHIQNEWTRRGLDIGEFGNFIHQKETAQPTAPAQETPRETMPESSPRNLMEKRYTDAEKKVKDLMNKPREIPQAIQDASAEEVPYLFYEARKEYIKEDHPESVDDMIRELAFRMNTSPDGFLIHIINDDVNQGVEGRYTAKTPDLFTGELTPTKRKDLSARAVHIAELIDRGKAGNNLHPLARELRDIHDHLVNESNLPTGERGYAHFSENRAAMIQEIKESRGEPASTSRTRYQQRTTSPAQSDIKNVNDLDKPNKRGSRPAEAREADKRLIEKLEDTIRNRPESLREQAHTAMRLVTELKLAQSLKRYKDGHPTKGDEATKDNIYQIRRDLRDRLQELTIGM